MKEFTVEFYDNQDFLITRYVILEEDIQQAMEQAKQEAYNLIDNGDAITFTVSVLDNNTRIVYKTITKN